MKNGIVYATFSNGYIYALNAKTGKKIWSYRARDGYKGPPPPGNLSGRCADGTCERGTTDFDPVHPGVTYPKIHGATAFCDNKVFFMTLSGWAYGLDAKTGKLLWKRYADGPEFPGELTWWEYEQGGPTNPNNKSAGLGTRRFEAVPGLACLNGEVQAAGAPTVTCGSSIRRPGRTARSCRRAGPRVRPEGRLRRHDRRRRTSARTPRGTATSRSGSRCHRSAQAGAATTSSPRSTTASSGSNGTTHAPPWRRTYDAPLPLELEVGNCSSFLLSLPHGEHGFITQGVVGSPMALDPDIDGKGADPILYAAAQDGRLYVIAITAPATPPAASGRAIPTARACSRASACSRTTIRRRRTRVKARAGPWDYDEMALSALVLGGNVLYVPTWDNKMTAFDVRDPAEPEEDLAARDQVGHHVPVPAVR